MKEANHVSLLWLYLHYIPSAFIHYLSLTLTTLIVGLFALAFVADKNVITFKKKVLPRFVTPPSQNLPVTSTAESQRTTAAAPNGAENLDAPVPCTRFAESQSTRPPVNLQGTGAPQPSSAGDLTAHALATEPPQPQAISNISPSDPELQELLLLMLSFEKHCSTDGASWAWVGENSRDVLLTLPSHNIATRVAEVFKEDTSLQGSRILHKRIEIGPQTKYFELLKLTKQLLDSIREAREIDPDCTLQFGSFSVVKYTESGQLKWWKLQTHWTPIISNITRRITLLDLLRGSNTMMISGLNLDRDLLKAATKDQSEILQVLEHRKIENGEELFICKEPGLVRSAAAMFGEKVFICASKHVKVEEGVTIKLQSKPIFVDSQYLTSGMKSFTPNLKPNLNLTRIKSFIPSRPIMIIILSLALLEGLIQKLLEENPILRGLWQLFRVCTLITFTTVCSFPKLLSTLLLLGLAAASTSDEPRYPRPPPGCTEEAQLNDSVWELYSPVDQSPDVDIIFFHGLQRTDNYEAFWKTWLAKDEEQLVWPKDWLSKQLPNARILAVSYDSIARKMEHSRGYRKSPRYRKNPRHRYRMEHLAELLIHDIVLDTNLNIGQKCPVILVGHCVGGLVIKLLLSNLTAGRGDVLFATPESGGLLHTINQDYRIATFLSHVKGRYFYATPGEASIPIGLTFRLTRPSRIFKLLTEINYHIAVINNFFERVRRYHRMKTCGIVEGLPTKWGGYYGVVAEETSARLGLDIFYTHFEADHFSICQARSMTDPEVIGLLVEFISSCVRPSEYQVVSTLDSGQDRVVRLEKEDPIIRKP